MNEHRAAL